MAMLTLPARSKAIDTFSDILELPDEATVGVFQWSSMNEILQETSDPTLQVSSQFRYLIFMLKIETNRLMNFIPLYFAVIPLKLYCCLIYITGCQQTHEKTRYTTHS